MKILFFGLGSIGKKHLKLINELNYEVEVLAFRSGTSNNTIENISVKEFYSLDKVFMENPEVAFITNPNHLHMEYAIKAAKNNCHLFIEKPLSNNLDRVDELINIVNKKGLITYIGCDLRFNPVIRKTKELLQKEVIGEIYSTRIECGSYLPNWRPNRDYRDIYSAKAKMGGGVILDLIHEIDYAYWLFGDIDNLKSYQRQISHLQIETEDIAEIILEFSNGIVGNIHLDYYRRTPKRTMEIIGEKGVIEADLINEKVKIDILNNNKEFNFNTDTDYDYKEQLKYFFNAIINDQNCFNDVIEGKEVLETALKAKQEG